MPDVFISYAREDIEVVRGLAGYLKGQGFAVWWDTEILASDDFHDAILNALTSARAAIVIWTKHSVRSFFVRDEARYALVRKKLIAVKSPDLPYDNIPFGFQCQHTDDVSDRDRIVAALQKLGAKTANGGDEASHAAGRAEKAEADAPPKAAAPSIGEWNAFRRGFLQDVPEFVSERRSSTLVAGAIAGSIVFSVAVVVALPLLLELLRSRNAGSDLENFVGLIALSPPWLLNLRTFKKLFRQRAFKGGWILAVFWSLLTYLFAAAVVYGIATLLGEPDMEKYAVGNKILNLITITSPVAALGYAYYASRLHR